jgi:hypothetical protein
MPVLVKERAAETKHNCAMTKMNIDGALTSSSEVMGDTASAEMGSSIANIATLDGG